MISEAVLQALKRYIPEDNICLQEPMAGHTTFRIGGPADCLLQIESEEQLRKVRHYLNLVGIPWFILGNGSNLLVSDEGFSGVVLQIGSKMQKITVQGSRIIAQAGATLAQVAKTALEQELAGFEFASGIPGTVGGGVVMNAGAYGGEMSQVVERVTVLDRDGERMELDNATMEFGYRSSTIRNHSFAVTEVAFQLRRGNGEKIKALMEELAERRREKQPLEYPSAGSTFKRPVGHFAGQLSMDAGLRGFQIGGAQVSEKHCGGVIHPGDATARDVRDVICEVQERVRDAFHVSLEPEIMFLGFKPTERWSRGM